MNVHSLFPLAVAEFFYNAPLSNLELNSLLHEECKEVCDSGFLKTTSINILQKKNYNSISSFFKQSVIDYNNTVMSIPPVKYIDLVESSAFFIDKNNECEKDYIFHSKQSSFFSNIAVTEHGGLSCLKGVFFVETEESSDKIYFFKLVNREHDINIKNYNPWNSTNWWLQANHNKLYIFPSYTPFKLDISVSLLKPKIVITFDIFLHS
jgi:hypothetical protein